ncbi:hypothetical protein SRHO_G00166080 [Serrasalmus rhombeus]
MQVAYARLPEPTQVDTSRLLSKEERRLYGVLCLYCEDAGHVFPPEQTSGTTPRKVAEEAAMEEYVQEALDQGFLRPSTSSAT